MARKSEITHHPHRAEIERDLINSVSYRNIAKRYGVSLAAIHRYVHGRFRDMVGEQVAKREQAHGEWIIGEVDKIMSRTNKMYDACDEFLTDPDNPEKYWLGPRAGEIEVAFWYRDDKKRTVVKERLDVVWRRIEQDQGVVIVDMDYKRKDPRELLLRTAQTNKQLLELLARIRGDIQESSDLLAFFELLEALHRERNADNTN